jgi:hypothetical protein|tara:strand:+ start:660 stop:944 length:285 start_codon:yes stop_codon:yes gene_type:complete
MDFIQSVDNLVENIRNINSIVETGKNDLTIIVDNNYEIFLTHYPLWNNEPFLYAIGCIKNKLILKKNIPEDLIVKEFEKIKLESSLSQDNQLLN